MRRIMMMFLLLAPFQLIAAEDADAVFAKMRRKLEVVKDYVADVKMKVDISFMRVPQLNGRLYFKAPDKMKLDRNGGLAIMPKKSMSMTLSSLIPSGEATVIDVGYEQVGNIKARVIKVVPSSEKTDIVLTKIWVDEARLLALRTETTTRDNGTIKMELRYGRYEAYGLPDHVTFLMDVKDYKLPKGVTMDYENTSSTAAASKAGTENPPKKGKIEIHYLNYQINKGIPDDVFTDKKK